MRLATADSRVRRRLELAIPLAAAAVLLAACVLVSRTKTIWTDEAVTWMFVTDPSLAHLLGALWGGVEPVPPLYYIVGWAWARTFGGGELALRLLSSLGFSVALFVVWRTVRSAYPLRATAVGVLGVFGTSSLMLEQNAEARFYGVFTAACALALAASAAAASRLRPSRRLLVGTALAHAALVLTHTLGSFFSGAMLAAIVARDLAARRFRPRVYLSVAAGWVLLLAWAVPLLRAARALARYNWIPVPGLGGLTTAYAFGSTLLLVVVLAAALLGALSGPSAARQAPEVAPTEREPGEPSVADRRGALLALAGGLFAVPLLVWVLAQVGPSLFLPRYMLPGVLAWSVVLAHVASLGGTAAATAAGGRGWLPTRTLAAAGFVALCTMLLLFPIRWAREYEPLWGRGSGDSRRELVAKRVREIGGVPIITESIHDFLPLAYYAPAGATPFFAQVPDSGDAMQSVLMRRYKELGYFASSVVSPDDFVCAHERFAVADAQGLRWYDERLRDDPKFESQVVDSAFRRQQDGRLVRLVLVRRRPGAPDGTCPPR